MADPGQDIQEGSKAAIASARKFAILFGRSCSLMLKINKPALLYLISSDKAHHLK